jgi:hypothetical protein
MPAALVRRAGQAGHWTVRASLGRPVFVSGSALLDRGLSVDNRYAGPPMQGVMSVFGFALAFLSLSAAIITFALKLMFWDSYPIGIAPIIISQFTLLGILMMCVGVLGEYVGAIYIQTLNRDRVHEKKRLNF